MTATRFAVVGTLVAVALLASAAQSQAQTVSWATGFPSVGQTGTPPMSYVDVKGTYTQPAPWHTRQTAKVCFVPPQGGTTYSIVLDIRSGDSGYFDPATQTIVAKRINVVPAGTYNVYIEHMY